MSFEKWSYFKKGSDISKKSYATSIEYECWTPCGWYEYPLPAPHHYIGVPMWIVGVSFQLLERHSRSQSVMTQWPGTAGWRGHKEGAVRKWGGEEYAEVLCQSVLIFFLLVFCWFGLWGDHVGCLVHYRQAKRQSNQSINELQAQALPLDGCHCCHCRFAAALWMLEGRSASIWSLKPSGGRLL